MRLKIIFSRRRIAALLVVLPILAAAAATGRANLVLCLLAVALAGIVHLSRRIGAVHRSTQAALRELRSVVDQLQRRLLASVEKERLAAGDRHVELVELLNRTERLTGRGAELLLREQSREIEALLQLFRVIAPRAPMPTGGALQPTDLLGLVHVTRDRLPRRAVVLGGGSAAVWLGYALDGTGGTLVAVEHDRSRAEHTRARLAEHGLPAVEVRHAPLAELSVEGRTVEWYDVDALTGVQDIDLLVVAGAPGPDALAPALHVLGRRLAGAAAVVVDEASAPVAPRQGGSFGLTVRRSLSGRWIALARPSAPSHASA